MTQKSLVFLLFLAPLATSLAACDGAMQASNVDTAAAASLSSSPAEGAEEPAGAAESPPAGRRIEFGEPVHTRLSEGRVSAPEQSKRSVAREPVQASETGNTKSEVEALYALSAQAETAASSLELLYRALAIQQQSLRSDDPRLATTLYKLAYAYNWAGNASAAEAMARRVLDITDEDAPEAAQGHTVLGMLARAQGDRSTTTFHYAKAVEIGEKHGSDDLDSFLGNLGAIYSYHSVALAEPVLLRSVEVAERQGDQETLIYTLAHLGWLYQHFKDYDRCLKVTERALKLSTSYFGVQHHKTRELSRDYTTIKSYVDGGGQGTTCPECSGVGRVLRIDGSGHTYTCRMCLGSGKRPW